MVVMAMMVMGVMLMVVVLGGDNADSMHKPGSVMLQKIKQLSVSVPAEVSVPPSHRAFNAAAVSGSWR